MPDTDDTSTERSGPAVMAARLLLRGWERAEVVVALCVHFGLDDTVGAQTVETAAREVLEAP